MTTITMNLPDALFEKAKLAGFDEKVLTDKFSVFLEQQLANQQKDMAVSTDSPVEYSESILKAGGILSKYTDKKLTIEEMHAGVAKAFSKLDKSQI